MKRLILALLALATGWTSLLAQRQTDILDRGLVAVPSGSGAFVSWRIFGEEYYDTQYNLYRNGVKIAGPLSVSNYVDPDGRSGSKYQVAAVVRGTEQEKCAEVTRLNQQYIQFAVKSVTSRTGSNITNDYNINDIALADVDGDGMSEFIVKRNYVDGSSVDATAFNLLECYNIKGDRLWYIDLGPNMVSGPDEQYDAVGYDWDGDGKAEILLRGADNMIIYHADGTTTNIGNMNVNTRNTVNQTANMTYTNSGAEYLLYLDGLTGKPYPIGNNGQLWMDYPLPRGNVNDWGDGYGHRSTKHYFGAPFLDGRHAFIFLGRGCYTKHHMKAFSVNPDTHKLTQYWEWKGETWPYFGQGYHNYGIADVDWDGRDEIVFGSMVIDDNGKGLHTTGLGHGDAQHCSDFDPYRHGQEIFACNEDSPAMNYRDGTTGKIYYRLQSTSDDGRALCGNFSNNYPGAIGHSSQSGTISCVADKVISGAPGGFTNNWRIYWDGDLLEEGLDGASSREGAARVFKADGSIVFTADGTANCNWTKNTPSAVGDILGDWREEIVQRTTDNKYIRVYTTNISTKWRNYTLWHDHQYRQGMVWESMGYNQPPHASYFLGELEGITIAPPPLTMTGRTEVSNNGTIGTEHNDKHVIVCETNDTHITVAEGANPYMVTFNIPSWVQGTNSTNTSGNPNIRYTYYNCEVSGAAFTGDMRLVKQGDGTLVLPKTDNTYTGETNVWAGTLVFDGTLKNSKLWLNRFAKLISNGGAFRSIKMEYDAHLLPGGESNIGTISIDTLTMGFGARVVIDLNTEGKLADNLQTIYMSIEKKNWQYGPKYLQPVFEFVVPSGQDILEGNYLLGTIETLNGNLDDIRIEGLGTKMKSKLALEEGKLYLVIEGMRDPSDVFWTGTESNIWNVADTENFTSSEGENDIFVSGDNVHFDDTASKFTVTLNGELEADTVFVSNEAKYYTFSGTGSLVGSTTLVKQGNGLLTIKNDNSYTGGNRLSGGIVSVSSLANANQPKGNLGGVTNVGTKFIMENGAELRTTAAVTNGSPIRFETDEGGIINNQADYIVDKAMSGTVLTKKGAGWMKLNTANSSLNRLVIVAGTVQCINANTPAKTVEYQGGTLNENTGSSYNVFVPSGKTGNWYMANRSTYSNKVTGSGTLTVYCTTEKGTNYYATRTLIQCNFSEFEGILKPASSLDDDVKRFTLNTSTGMPKGTMNIASDVEVQNSGKTFHIGKLSGTGKLGGSCRFSNGTSVGANTWQVGNDNDWATSVRVTSNANFQKVGKGRIIWSGASDNTGTTTVSEGELCMGANGLLGTGKLTIDEGAVFSCSSKTKVLKNSSVVVNGILSVNASRCATNVSDGCTSFYFEKGLTVNGTIRITATDHSLQPGDSIRIFSAASFSGKPTFDFQDGIEWDTSRISEGLLFVKAIGASISDVVNDATPRNIYDVRGRLVRRNATHTEGLPAGVYVCEGRKFVIR
ncbi:MAG: autotransporter-associated beta strand repeat-containing protein [Prevotella sp.]|nr:autotransporter-associated beta strand repeat-containing protein [Prevotella sp.]